MAKHQGSWGKGNDCVETCSRSREQAFNFLGAFFWGYHKDETATVDAKEKKLKELTVL